MNNPQMPRRTSELPPSPTHVVMLLVAQSKKRYAAIKEMLKNQVDGFADLQKESNLLAQAYMQEDGTQESERIHRLALSYQAVLAAAEINGQDLQRHLQAELFLQGELNRWQMGKPPTHFQAPRPQQPQQPIVPGYTPPAQLPAAQGQGAPQPPAQSYFRPGPNGLEPVAAFATPQQPQQPQQQPMMPQMPQMPMQPPMQQPFPMPGYAMPPGYPQQQPMMPQMPQQPMYAPQPQPQAPYGYPQYPQQAYAQPQYPQQPYYPQPSPMPANHLPVMQQGQDPNAQPTMMPLMPLQQPVAPQQFATPDAARQAMLPDAPPPPAVPTSVVHFPTPNGQGMPSQANGAPQPQKQ